MTRGERIAAAEAAYRDASDLGYLAALHQALDAALGDIGGRVGALRLVEEPPS